MKISVNKVSLILIFFLTTALYSPLLFSDTGTNVYRAYPYALGAFAGELGGTGLSYQQWLGKFGYEVSFGGYYTPPDCSFEPNSVFLTYSIGLQFQYALFSENLLKKFPDWIAASLYLFTGTVHVGSLSQPCKVNPDFNKDDLSSLMYLSDTSKSPVYTPDFGVGFGIGIEPVLFRHFSFPMEFGIDSIWPLGSLWPDTAGFIVQGGFRYRF
ncbi:MAG: hypothetical protein DRP57_07150 [Spirochaetes bacterium]|nr:MAG: hypothetical protein DRP57_07150 [Spirochaetota bacterium]